MKFLSDKSHLEAALSPLLPMVAAKETNMALRCVHMIAKGEELVLQATNKETSIETRIDSVKIDEEGACIVPARQFAELLSTINDATVTFELRGETLFVPTSSGEFEIVTGDVVSFPGLSFMAKGEGVDIPIPAFRELLNTTEFACAKEATRYAMNGLLVQVKDKHLHLVATDGRRLAVNGSPLEGVDNFEGEALLPNRSLQNAVRAADSRGEDSMQLHFGDSSVFMSFGTMLISMQKIAGSFPDYQNVLPQGCTNTAEINKSLLESNLRRARIMTDDINPAIKLSFEGSQALIEAESAGLGSARTSLDVHLDGSGGYIIFNPNFILDALKVAETDTIRFEFDDATAPGKFVLGERYIYVVMPITTS